MSDLYELGKGLRGMGDFLRGLSGAEGAEQQTGSSLVGPANSNAYGIACVVTFEKDFASTPVVVANAIWDKDVQGTDLPDTFAVTITQVDKHHFRANVYRVDHLLAWTLENPKPLQGWSQPLRLNWIACAQACPQGGNPE